MAHADEVREWTEADAARAAAMVRAAGLPPIVTGFGTTRDLGLRKGDEIRVDISGQSRPYRITGVTHRPDVGETDVELEPLD